MVKELRALDSRALLNSSWWGFTYPSTDGVVLPVHPREAFAQGKISLPAASLPDGRGGEFALGANSLVRTPPASVGELHP